MGILSRVCRLFRAHSNRGLRHLENPELMAEQAIQDMQDGLRKGKLALVKALAEEKKCETLAERHKTEAEAWRTKAKSAVGQGEEELAREAIKRARGNDTTKEIYRKQAEEQQRVVDKLRVELTALETKINVVKQKKEILVARKDRADSVREVNEAIAGIGRYLDSGQAFDSLQERVDDAEAHAAAVVEITNDDLEDKFQALHTDGEVEAELSALKSQTGE